MSAGGFAETLQKLEVADPLMSTNHALLFKERNRWRLEDCQSRNGTYVNGLRIRRTSLRNGDVLQLGQTFFFYREVGSTSAEEPDEPSPSLPDIPGFRTLHLPLVRQLEALVKVIPTQISIILEGESGTGKELIAKAIHTLSGRKGKFVGVNCAALTPTLIHSELFGHTRGAFSNRLGLIESANGGTLLLDEVADLSNEAQMALLRVLQDRHVVPVGGREPIAIDIRICCATQLPLEGMVASSKLRKDLFARMAGFKLCLPALRDRREDMGLLVSDILRSHLPGPQVEKISFAKDSARALFRHTWPLNIRELEKSIQVAAALAADGCIRLKHLPESLRRAPRRARPAKSRRAELIGLLQEYEGNIAAVGRALGKGPFQIRRWVKRYQLNLADFRGNKPPIPEETES